MKYKEKLNRIPSTLVQKQDALLTQAFEEQIAAMENNVVGKTAEMEAMRARMHDLEQAVTKKELNLAEQKRMIKRIKVSKQRVCESLKGGLHVR
jgi:uncharacterized coiled-coil DUF342 family protein